MRRVIVTFSLAAGMVLGPASAAGAAHTADCAHARTTRAHQAVPHRNHGTHQAHMSIPYCPPEDAPRHRL